MGAKDEIDSLEQKILRLKTEYEQYFARVLKREPAKLREEVDKLVLKHSNANITNTSVKFKLNTVVAKYNSYKQYWTRILRAIEEGTYVREAHDAAHEPNAHPRQPPRAAGEETAGQGAAPGGNGGPNALAEAYKNYIEARKSCSEPVDNITYESFVKTVEKSRRVAEEKYKVKEVDLKVVVKDGKTVIAMTPKGK